MRKEVQEHTCLGSAVDSNGECGKEMKIREQTRWGVKRGESGALCDRRVAVRATGKVRSLLLYGLKTAALTKRQEVELKKTEGKALRFSISTSEEQSGPWK